MVLTPTRVALIATLALCLTRPCDAQRGGRFGRGASDGPRPALFGFALECSGCTRGQPEGRVFLPVWHYTEYPRVVAVAPGGVAEQAGIHEGDVLTSVDGLSILSPEGARRFSGTRLGESIHLTLNRGGKTVDVMLAPHVGRFPSPFPGDGFTREPVPREYSGRVGNASVDVTSDEPVVATTDASGTLTLRIGGTIVRVRPPLPAAPPATTPVGPRKP